MEEADRFPEPPWTPQLRRLCELFTEAASSCPRRLPWADKGAAKAGDHVLAGINQVGRPLSMSRNSLVLRIGTKSRFAATLRDHWRHIIRVPTPVGDHLGPRWPCESSTSWCSVRQPTVLGTGELFLPTG